MRELYHVRKVYDIPELSKHAGIWCTHCKPGKGCTIHDHLPRQCAEFYCMWRYDEKLPPRWKPDKSKMVVTVESTSKYIIVQVDPNAPTAWRNQPTMTCAYGRPETYTRANTCLSPSTTTQL
jgi:hypothetical protein